MDILNAVLWAIVGVCTLSLQEIPKYLFFCIWGALMCTLVINIIKKR